MYACIYALDLTGAFYQRLGFNMRVCKHLYTRTSAQLRREQPAKSAPLLQRGKAVKPIEPEKPEEDGQLEEKEQRVAIQQEDNTDRLTDRQYRGVSDTRSGSDHSAEDNSDSDDSNGDGEYTL